jgi:hypothetical protein
MNALQNQIQLMADTSAKMLKDSIVSNDEYHINKILFEGLFEPNLSYDNNAIIIAAYEANNIKIMLFLFEDKTVYNLLESENLEYFDKIQQKVTQYKLKHF